MHSGACGETSADQRPRLFERGHEPAIETMPLPPGAGGFTRNKARGRKELITSLRNLGCNSDVAALK